MPKLYRVADGHSFRLADGALATAGDEIKLDDDVAAEHAHRLIPEPVAAAPSAAPQPDADAAPEA